MFIFYEFRPFLYALSIEKYGTSKMFGYNTVHGMSVKRFWTDNCRPMQPAFAKLEEQCRENVRNFETRIQIKVK